MDDFRNTIGEKEKIARAISGIDTSATYFNIDNKTLDEHIDNAKRVKWNESVEEIGRRFEDHERKLQEYADEYAKNLNGVQIMPINNNIIVRPFNENPFQKVKTLESGIIIPNGLTPEYKSNETGEYEEAEQYIKVGIVIEAGSECKWIKNGDTIMWPLPAEIVIPFYDFGFRLVPETRVLCVINDDLIERFKKNG